MKIKNNIISILLFFIIKTSYSQDFYIVKTPADSLRDLGDITGAITEYHKTFILDPTDNTNLFNYCCALAINNQNDSCFKYLEILIQHENPQSIFTDPDFYRLRNDKRWPDFENKAIQTLEVKYGKTIIDKDYAKKLWYMRAADQAYYSEIDLAENTTKYPKLIVEALWDLKNTINLKNQNELELLIEKKGWPKISKVGSRAASAAFLIIQHSDSEKQKKYLPILKEYCELQEADWQDYALMYDRIQTSENKPQKYGTQIRFNEVTNKNELYPLEDETKVNEWRKAFGMGPLEDYLSLWNIKFEPKK